MTQDNFILLKKGNMKGFINGLKRRGDALCRESTYSFRIGGLVKSYQIYRGS